MTPVEIHFRCAKLPSQSASFALANVREVYGIRKLNFDQTALTLRVEYDATRLNAATVASLVREAGVDIAEDIPQATTEPVTAA